MLCQVPGLGQNSELEGTNSPVKVKEEVQRPEEYPRDNRQDGHLSGSTVSSLHTETIPGLTQQSTSTESSDHFLGFSPQSFHTQGWPAPHPVRDDLSRLIGEGLDRLLCNGPRGHQAPIPGDRDGTKFEQQQLAGGFFSVSW